MRILIVEDEPGIVAFLTRGLTAHGHQVESCDDGADGALLAADENIDFVLLDISLPGLDGHAVLQRIRAVRPSLPVLMLTARGDMPNKVAALNAGADDYLTKPFDFQELEARIRALVRRADQPTAAQLTAGDLTVDLVSHRVQREDQSIELSSREFALLAYFMQRPRQVLTRDQILAALWDQSFEPGSNVVDVYIRYLRRKLDRDGEPSLIATVRGTGYRFDPPATASLAPAAAPRG